MSQPLQRSREDTPQGYFNNITITNPIHPLYGQSLSVRHVRRLQGSNEFLQLIVNHPDGGYFSVSLADINLPCERLNSNPISLFDIEKLLQLAQIISVASTGFD